MELFKTADEYKDEILKHIRNVKKYMSIVKNLITNRELDHDRTKLESPELEVFTEYTPKLANSTYDNVALKHHYENNRHHLEHFENGIGINDMNLIDIVEMLCDWKAETLKHNDGDLLRSIEINASRFGYDNQLKQILINTAKLFDEYE